VGWGGQIAREEGKMKWVRRYFLYMYEYVTLKPVQAILRRGVEEKGEHWRVVCRCKGAVESNAPQKLISVEAFGRGKKLECARSAGCLL
jgi:hypothetical protein